MRSLAKALKLTESEELYLRKVSRSGKEEARRVRRAGILLQAYDGVPISKIAKQYNQVPSTVTDLLKKALTYGVEASLNDLPRSGSPIKIGTEERAWIVYCCGLIQS